MKTIDRNQMYDVLSDLSSKFPDSNLQLVAVGLGAATAVMQGDVLNITLEDGSGLAFITE